MRKFIKNFFYPPEPEKPVSTPSKQDIKRAVNDVRNVPRYPPFDNGVPVIEIDDLITTQLELIDRIRMAFGLSPEMFEEMVMQTIRNYANYVHLLPATSRENHNNAGGLFRLGLEVGFYALQAADGKIYSNKESAERRRILHPKWVYATFIAGLCSEIQLPFTTMTIMSSDGKQWPSLRKPLHLWANEVGTDNYFIHWTDNINGSSQPFHFSALYILNMIIPASGADYLNNDNPQIFSDMFSSISGASRHSDGNVIGEIVRYYRDLIVEKDIKSNPSFYGKLTVGSHLAPYVIDIMRELIKDGVWTINSNKSRVWYTKEGCYIVWNAAAAEICAVMQKRKVAGVPTSNETLAELLLQSNLIEVQKTGSPLWEITLPNNPRLVEAVKIADPSLIIDQSENELYPISIFAPAQTTTKNEPAKSAASAAQTQQIDIFGPEDAQPQKEVEHVKESDNARITPEAPRQQGETDKPVEEIGKQPQSQPKPQKQEDKKAVDEAPNPQRTPTQKNNDSQPKAQVINPDIINQISESTRLLLNAIKSDMEAGKSEFPVWMNARGLIISKEEFESHGMPHIKALDELVSNNWVVREPETKRVLYKTEKEGVKISGYLINKAIALAIGFKDSDA